MKGVNDACKKNATKGGRLVAGWEKEKEGERERERERRDTSAEERRRKRRFSLSINERVCC